MISVMNPGNPFPDRVFYYPHPFVPFFISHSPILLSLSPTEPIYCIYAFYWLKLTVVDLTHPFYNFIGFPASYELGRWEMMPRLSSISVSFSIRVAIRDAIPYNPVPSVIAITSCMYNSILFVNWLSNIHVLLVVCRKVIYLSRRPYMEIFFA